MSRVWDSLRKAEGKRSEDTAREGARGNPDERSASDRRVSLRQKRELPVSVCGLDPQKKHFREEAHTINLSESGCLIALETEVSSRERLFLTNAKNQTEQVCRVVHVGRRIYGKLMVGVEFPRPARPFWDAPSVR